MKNLVIRSGSLRMGGLERVLIEMLQNLDTQKYKISLIIEDNSGKENVFIDQIPKGIELYFIKPESMIAKTHFHRERKKKLYHKLMYNILMSREHRFIVSKTKEILKEIEKKSGKIDVFLDYDWGARRYVEKLDLKYKIVWIHNSVPKLLKKNSKIARFGKNLAKYDKVVAICDEMKKELEEIYPYLKKKIVRIYNPFNFERIRKQSSNREGISEKDLELLKDNYIVGVSRLDTAQKDYYTLLKGFKLYKDKAKDDTRLYIVGDGPSRDEIQKLIESLELKKDVILLGLRKNPYIWIKNSKLFVHSSKYEGFGLVLVEAACLGKSIISSNCEVGPKEILGNGEYGKLFEVGDCRALSETLYEMLRDDSKREFYEKKALERSEIFDAKVVIKDYEKLIDIEEKNE